MKLNNLSLTKRLLLLYIVGPLLLFILFGGTSYYFVRTLLDNNMQVSMQSDLKQTLEDFEKARKSLQAITEQFALGNSAYLLSETEEETQAYEISTMIHNIKNEIGIISFTNSDLRLFGYYDTEQDMFLYANNSSQTEALMLSPVLAHENEFTYYGPMVSQQRFSEDLVLAVTRRVPNVQLPVVVYAEIHIQPKTDTLFLNDAQIIVINSEGTPVYNTFEDSSEYELIYTQVNDATQGTTHEAHWTKAQSAVGYSLVLSISKADYNRRLRTFLMQSALILMGLFALLALSGFLVWKTAVQPINRFKREIQLIRTGDITHTEITQKINIREYNALLEEFMLMKGSIRTLLHQAKVDERERARLEYERLLYQINPHFLMNTLDTIHWLAVSKGVDDIDKVALAMNKLLHYNLKSEGVMSPLRDELAVVGQYVTLQQTRFDFTYVLDLKDERMLDALVPRFILQPLVENAIYHGLGEQGKLTVGISRSRKELYIFVADNGRGMTEAEQMRLQDASRRFYSSGEMGIGLSYVKHVLNEKFAGDALFKINSKIGEGTTITLHIPLPGEMQK